MENWFFFIYFLGKVGKDFLKCFYLLFGDEKLSSVIFHGFSSLKMEMENFPFNLEHRIVIPRPSYILKHNMNVVISIE